MAIWIIKRIKTKQTKTKQIKKNINLLWFAIKSGIMWNTNKSKRISLDWKSQFRTNKYSHFCLFMLNSAKKMSKWLKNEQKCSKIPIIWKYLTLLDFTNGICFVCKINRLACFDLIRVLKNENKMNTKYFQIIFFN